MKELSNQQFKVLRVLKALRNGVSSSQLRSRGVKNVSARIYELRRAGYHIHMVQCFDIIKGRLITKYKLDDLYFWSNS